MIVTLANLLNYASTNHIGLGSDVFTVISRYLSDTRKPQPKVNKLTVAKGAKAQHDVTEVRENPFGEVPSKDSSHKDYSHKVEYSPEDLMDLFST